MKVHQFVTCVKSSLEVVCNVRGAVSLEKLSLIYPDQLKIAKVIPIFKKGDKLLVSNYRPISLLSNINKIFEKLVYSRLYSFLEIHKLHL